MIKLILLLAAFLLLAFILLPAEGFCIVLLGLFAGWFMGGSR